MTRPGPYRLDAGRRRFIRASMCVAAASPFVGSSARAAAYPTRPVTLVVPWPAGGTTDLAARTFAQSLEKSLGVAMIVENKPGANGMIGTSAVARAAPDGQTLLLATAETHAINPYVYDSLSYDPVKDFAPIGAFATNPYCIVARGDFPAADLRELVEVVKKKPGQYTYSSASLGSASQVVMEMFKAAAGLDILHVPFQGEAPAVTALMGGQVDMEVMPLGRAVALRSSGKIKAYAVTPDNRVAGMADVPTLREEGFPTLNIANWFAIMAPRATPDAVLATLTDRIALSARNADVRAALAKLGLGSFDPMPRPQFVEFVAHERERWRVTIQGARIHAA